MSATTPTTTPYDNDSRVPNVIAMVAGTLVIGTLVTVARFYTRIFIVKSLGIDDWFALLSLVSHQEATRHLRICRLGWTDNPDTALHNRNRSSHRLE